MTAKEQTQGVPVTETTNSEILATIKADRRDRDEYQQGSVAWRANHDKKHEDIETRIASMEKTFEQGKGAATVLMNLGKIVGLIVLVTAAVGTALKSMKGVG